MREVEFTRIICNFLANVTKSFLLESRSMKLFCHGYLNYFRWKAPLFLEVKEKEIEGYPTDLSGHSFSRIAKQYIDPASLLLLPLPLYQTHTKTLGTRGSGEKSEDQLHQE